MTIPLLNYKFNQAGHIRIEIPYGIHLTRYDQNLQTLPSISWVN